MTPQDAVSPVWGDADLIAALFAVDPIGLGGVVVRACPGPVRDRWLGLAQALLPQAAPMRRIPLSIEDDRLLGGLDLTASLAAGRPVVQHGVLASADGGAAILSMAERINDATGARLAAVLDSGEVVIEREGLATRLSAHLGLIALDEGVEDNERPPEALLDRLAFWIDLTPVSVREPMGTKWDDVRVLHARGSLASVTAPPLSIIQALCAAASSMGVLSLRPPILALRAARAHAALCGRRVIETEDAVVASRLVLGPRALCVPAPEPQDASNDEAPPEAAMSESSSAPDQEPPAEKDENESVTDTDRIVEAIRAALPENLLEQVRGRAERPQRAPRAGGSGAATKSSQRGRSLGARPGVLRPGDRLNLPATLLAAAPWQKLRSGGTKSALIRVRRDDFRIRRFMEQRESTSIFVVDASGSAAFQRLAESKGAVELLLSKAYVSRSRVALIAFRNKGAEILLQPTRSLTRAKRSLADLPGGGGTPLAAGLEAALALGLVEKGKDRTPLLVILTDGRANIGIDGAPGRPAAEADAMAAARRLGASGVGAAFVDTSPRPQPDGDRFARAMNAVYAPLPYVDAARISSLVDNLRGGRS